jgi:serine/threonine protein kinase
MQLNTTEREIVALAVQRFLDAKQPTSRRQLVAKYKNPAILNGLINTGILKQNGDVLSPGALAFHYVGDTAILMRAQSSVETVVRALQDLYRVELDKTNFSRTEIQDQARRNDQSDPEEVSLGLYLARDLNVPAQWAGDQLNVSHVVPTEQIITLKPESVWNEYIRRNGGEFLEEAGGKQSELMSKRDTWERVRPLGGGGQSDVFLVRSPARVAEREACLQELAKHSSLHLSRDTAESFARASWNYSRPDLPSELGALKVFKTRDAGPEAEQQALQRLKDEVRVLKQGRAGQLRHLDSDEDKGWLVTEYYPNGTLENHPFQFKGNVPLALSAFRSLVETVAGLHAEGIVHRDIKPANVFFGSESRLILGDFGIVFHPEHRDRVTVTEERVGPRDYMPQWADLGERLEKVSPNFDVYMLGKLLWCMVAGRLKLPREYHHRPTFDLTQIFPDNSHMHIINVILDKCVVEEPEKSLPSAQDLLLVVDTFLQVIGRGGQLLRDEVPRPCHICGYGFYRPDKSGGIQFWNGSSPSIFQIHSFVCDKCGHAAFFRRIGPVTAP